MSRGVCTVIFAFYFPTVLARMSFLICPCENMNASVFQMSCTPSAVFVAQPYPMPLLGTTFTLLPVQLLCRFQQPYFWLETPRQGPSAT